MDERSMACSVDVGVTDPRAVARVRETVVAGLVNNPGPRELDRGTDTDRATVKVGGATPAREKRGIDDRAMAGGNTPRAAARHGGSAMRMTATLHA